MILLDCELDFEFAVFRQSETKSGAFNVVHTLDHPTQSMIYGALAQSAGLLGYDYAILDKLHLTTPLPTRPPSRLSLINTAPISPLDWQPKGVLDNYTYDTLNRIYPRKLIVLDHPRYQFLTLAEDEESKVFLYDSFRLLARSVAFKKGLGLGIGYKKKFFNAFEAKIHEISKLKSFTKMKTGTIAKLLSPCPAENGDILLTSGSVQAVPYRNIHCTKEEEIARIYPEGADVIVKQSAPIDWYELREYRGRLAVVATDAELSDLSAAKKIALGVTNGIRLSRRIGDRQVKAFDPVFLARIN